MLPVAQCMAVDLAEAVAVLAQHVDGSSTKRRIAALNAVADALAQADGSNIAADVRVGK